MVVTRSMSRKQEERDRLLDDNLRAMATVFSSFSEPEWQRMVARTDAMILDENRAHTEGSLIQDALIEDALAMEE